MGCAASPQDACTPGLGKTLLNKNPSRVLSRWLTCAVNILCVSIAGGSWESERLSVLFISALCHRLPGTPGVPLRYLILSNSGRFGFF